MVTGIIFDYKPVSGQFARRKRQRESGPAFAEPQLKESVLQIPYNGLESFLQVERVLRRAIGSQAENVGLHVRFLNEEHCEFGSA